MQVVKLSPNHTELVKQFCQACDSAGYTNNRSLEAMKWGEQFDLPSPAHFWALMINNKIVSLSGAHEWTDPKIFRTLFRSATLPEYQNLVKGMSKNHMNSVPFSLLLPEQIQYGLVHGYEKFYITTSNSEHDASGKMSRTHRALTLLCKRGIVNFVENVDVYHTPQTVWSIVLDEYWQAVGDFKMSFNISP